MTTALKPLFGKPTSLVAPTKWTIPMGVHPVVSRDGNWIGCYAAVVRKSASDLEPAVGAEVVDDQIVSNMLKLATSKPVELRRQAILPMAYADAVVMAAVYRAQQSGRTELVNRDFGPAPDTLWCSANSTVTAVNSRKREDVTLMVACLRPLDDVDHTVWSLCQADRIGEALAYSTINALSPDNRLSDATRRLLEDNFRQQAALLPKSPAVDVARCAIEQPDTFDRALAFMSSLQK
jgi:hypothetical protein